MGQLLPILSNHLLSVIGRYKPADGLYERIIRVVFIQILQILYVSNQNNQKKSNWEEVQGLSWIFYED